MQSLYIINSCFFDNGLEATDGLEPSRPEYANLLVIDQDTEIRIKPEQVVINHPQLIGDKWQD